MRAQDDKSKSAALRLVRSLSLPFGAGRDGGAGELGDEAVAVADAVEGGVAGVLSGDLQSEDEGLDQARVEGQFSGISFS